MAENKLKDLNMYIIFGDSNCSSGHSYGTEEEASSYAWEAGIDYADSKIDYESITESVLEQHPELEEGTEAFDERFDEYYQEEAANCNEGYYMKIVKVDGQWVYDDFHREWGRLVYSPGEEVEKIDLPKEKDEVDFHEMRMAVSGMLPEQYKEYVNMEEDYYRERHEKMNLQRELAQAKNRISELLIEVAENKRYSISEEQLKGLVGEENLKNFNKIK